MCRMRLLFRLKIKNLFKNTTSVSHYEKANLYLNVYFRNKLIVIYMAPALTVNIIPQVEKVG